ncbi:MAG: UDP-N-acetylmuramoyl-tripeptide--D-alanyl-D-alanine ligase [Fidelibacterota bacterium]
MRITLPDPQAFAAVFSNATGFTLPESVAGIATDNRHVQPGDLFLAIQGENTDGHHFVGQAAQSGAAAALVSHSIQEANLTEINVSDPVETIGGVAQAWRQQFSLPVIGITGSNGKTTTKEIIRHLLAPDMAVHATEGNYNTSVGLPLSLLTLTRDHEVSILEMGANQPGDIQYLCRIAIPTYGIITNIAPAHLAGFGSIDAIAREKGALFQSLHDGTAFINKDDPRITPPPSPAQSVTFGFQPNCDFAADLWTDEDLSVTLTVNTIDIPIYSQNLTFAKNVLAALSLVITMGVSWDDVPERLKTFQPATGRSVVKKIKDTIIIDDTYNANLNSTRAAIDFLTTFTGKRQILVFGDMLELGDQSAKLHAAVGLYADEKGISALYSTGQESRHTDEAITGQLDHVHMETKEDLFPLLSREMNADTVLLFKGSRGMAMETLIRQLEEAA